MKTKILILSLISIFIFSCKSDDENAGTQPIPENEKLIDNIVSDGFNYEFDYNNDKTIGSLNIPGLLLFNYTYENNRISKIFALANGEALEYHLDYDQNGRISSFSSDDVVTPVTYNAAQNYYLYQKETGEEFILHLNENGDIYKASEYDPEYDETESCILLYDDSAKGVLTNTNNITIPTSLVFGEVFLSYYMFPISNKPVTTISLPGGNVMFENEFDDQGFVSKTIIDLQEEEPSVMMYNYTQL